MHVNKAKYPDMVTLTRINRMRSVAAEQAISDCQKDKCSIVKKYVMEISQISVVVKVQLIMLPC